MHGDTSLTFHSSLITHHPRFLACASCREFPPRLLGQWEICWPECLLPPPPGSGDMPRKKWGESREYWFICGVQGFHVVWFGSSIPLPTLPASKLCLFLSLRMCRRWSLLTGEGEGVGKEPNHTSARKLGLLKIIRYSLGVESLYVGLQPHRKIVSFTFVTSFADL